MPSDNVVVVSDNYGNYTVVQGYTTGQGGTTASGEVVAGTSNSDEIYLNLVKEKQRQADIKQAEEKKKLEAEQKEAERSSVRQVTDQYGNVMPFSKLSPEMIKEYNLQENADSRLPSDNRNYFEKQQEKRLYGSGISTQELQRRQAVAQTVQAKQAEQKATVSRSTLTAATPREARAMKGQDNKFVQAMAGIMGSMGFGGAQKGTARGADGEVIQTADNPLMNAPTAQSIGSVAGIVTNMWGVGKVGVPAVKVASPAVATGARYTAQAAPKVLKALVPGKTAVKVAAGLGATDVILAPIAQKNPEFNQKYFQPYLSAQKTAAEIYIGGKLFKAGGTYVTGLPIVQKGAQAISSTKMGNAALKTITWSFNVPTGIKPGITIAPIATALNVGVGAGTYGATYGIQRAFAPKSQFDKKTVQDLASMGYARAQGVYGGQEQYRNRLIDYYTGQGVSPTDAEQKVNKILSATASSPYQVGSEAEKQALNNLQPMQGFQSWGSNLLGSTMYNQFDFLRIGQRKQKVFGFKNPLYNDKIRIAELRGAAEYGKQKGLSKQEIKQLTGEVEAEMNRRDIALSASNLAINTYSEVMGQTLIYPKVFKNAENVAVKSTLGGRAKLAYVGLNTAPLGYVEGATTEMTRQLAFGEKMDTKRINEVGLFGLGSSTAIQAGLFATTPIKAKQTGNLQKGILFGSYILDAPYEFMGDVTAEKVVIPGMQRLSKTEFDRPVFFKMPDESLRFGIAKGEQPIIPRFRVLTGSNVFTGAQTQTNLNTRVNTQNNIFNNQNNLNTNNNALADIYAFSQIQVPVNPQPEPQPQQPKNMPDVFNYAFTGTQTQTQSNTFTNIATSVPLFRIPPPIPLGIPNLQGGGGGYSAKEKKRYLNELEAGRNLINDLVGMKLYSKSFKTKPKARRRHKKK